MGRKSNLTPAQWAEVDRRLMEGEAVRAVAREYPISEASIRERLAKVGRSETVQAVASKLVDAENSLAALPLPAQLSARNLADKLKAISSSLASAAEMGADTSRRLSAIANREAASLDDASPEANEGILKGVAALTRVANDAASISLGLLAANKESVKQLNDPPPEAQAPIRPQLGRDEWLKTHGLEQ